MFLMLNFKEIFYRKFILIYIILSVCARVIGNDPLFDLIIANCSSSFLEPTKEKDFLDNLIEIKYILYAVLFDSSGTKPSFK